MLIDHHNGWPQKGFVTEIPISKIDTKKKTGSKNSFNLKC